MDNRTSEKEQPIAQQVFLPRIIQFLQEIGIEVIEKELNDFCFLPGLDLGPNCIYMDLEKCKYPGDLLHEAGHIAVTEEKLRPFIGEDNFHERAGLPSWPSDGDEIATILWSYAAAKYLKIPLEFLFHPNGYKNESSQIIEKFNAGDYQGLPLLEWMGFCDSDTFPKMKRWMRA